MTQPRIGIIGGSGLYQMAGFVVRETKRLDTPFGEPSDAYVIGELSGRPVVFLPRHGQGHRISAPFVNYRANVFGMKLLGVEKILSVSAVGSLKEQYHPGHVVAVDQFIDRTKQRKSTFFDEAGLTAHILLAEPVCSGLAKTLFQAAKEAGAQAHEGGTYLCIEGPQLSTKAESFLYRSWGADVIGMTNATEARLAREAEICYATIALVTDYDCWRESEEAFSAEKIVATFKQNVEAAQKILKLAVAGLDKQPDDCSCRHALEGAIITRGEAIDEAVRRKLEPLVGRFFKE
ncbi:MAG: S-methyl-5'-thioadenosine phosphorylase [Myxococcales bacterium]|nr:MAG: S-methyl-5'-thioadenosine phosphorylase [Myxococcales bacterium]